MESWQEPWAPKWVKEVVDARRPSDLDSEAIQEVMADVRRLLDHLGRVGASGISRTELAVNVLADPHALDEGTKVEGAMTQALRYREHGFELDKRELWKRAGIRASRVSAPVLTWSLPSVGGSVLDGRSDWLPPERSRYT